ncbi:MAG: hypothetical protein HY784_08870 [Chloroflexi bacterium]|nr:hypothetical protein [Chloroflexota bacterium]
MIKHAFATKVVAAALMLLLLAIASLFAFAQPAAVKGMSVQQQPTPIPNDSIQMPSSKVQGGPPGKQVKVGNIMGRYWEKENRCFLFLDRDGTHIELQASPSVGSENLIRIAGSMQQVP